MNAHMRIWNHPIIEIFWHDCTVGKMAFGEGCPLFFYHPGKWCGATMIHLLGLRVRIGNFK